MTACELALTQLMVELREIAVAVSGGVDSVTLATFAHNVLGSGATMYHAVSPAVPPDATERVRAEAARRGWTLDVFDAGEFADPRYRANPANRCRFCKTNLYRSIRSRTLRQIASGTNTDDLGEFRPGLEAAREFGVRHPYVETGFNKVAIRRLAQTLGLGAIACLPASPCLASRVETGIRIDPTMLGMINAAEQLVAAAVRAQTVRCRVRASGMVIEVDQPSLAVLAGETESNLRRALHRLLTGYGIAASISFAAYRRGSAFLTATD